MYIAGTTNSVQKVPMVMPAKITRPMCVAAHGAGTGGNQQWHHPEHHRRGGHEDRAQPDGGGGLDRLTLGLARQLLLIGELHDENAVLGDQAHQRHQSHLRIDVEGREAEEQEHHRPESRHRHGHHHHQRVTEAFELCRQHQEDDDDGEAQRGEKPPDSWVNCRDSPP